MLKKHKPREEIKPVDKERQKVELEKPLKSIRKFNQINEEIEIDTSSRYPEHELMNHYNNLQNNFS